MESINRCASVVDPRKHRLHVGGETKRRLRLSVEKRQLLGGQRHFKRLHVILELRESPRADDCGCDPRLHPQPRQRDARNRGVVDFGDVLELVDKRIRPLVEKMAQISIVVLL
jgi:hypothetical protein